MKIRYDLPKHFLVRYGISICLPVAALLSYQILVKAVGGDLPTYITFYPAVMVTALLAGVGPGVVATAMAALLAAYWILPPQGFAISSFPDAVGIALFSFNCILISVMAELYRRARQRAADYAAELAILNERKRTEEALQRERDFISTVLDTAGALVVVLDNQGRITRFNRECEKVTGYSVAEVQGRVFWDFLIPEEELTGVRKTWEQLTAGDFPNAHGNHWLAKDGSRRLISWSNSAIVSEAGDIVHIIGTGTDITESKLAEMELERIRSLLSEGQRIAHLGSWEYIAATQETVWSDEEKRIYGLDPAGPSPVYEEMLRKHIHPDDAAMLDQTFRQALHIGSVFENENKIVRPDGSVRFIYNKAQPYFDENGKLLRYVGVTLDITERKQAEEALRLSVERLKLALEAANSGTWEWDLRTNENIWSEELWELYGLEPHSCEPSYEAWTQTIHPNDRAKTEQVVLEAARKGTEIKAEWRVLHPDSQESWLMSRGRPLHDANGQLQRFIGVVIDVTELKRAEMELAEHTMQLEAANKELESFSYSVAHDLRAPLRAIDGYARLILKKQGDKFDKDTLDKFNVIRSSTHLMGQLIDDLLTFSRLGRKEISSALLDMDILMKDAWKEVQENNPERNIEPTVGSMPPCYGDRALIKQVLINLLSNAMKFTKYKDAAEIVVGGYVDGNEIVYYVRDNGVGFDMAYYDKLFGVFQRLHSTDQFEGTGVGLATVQRLIRRHGGRVWAEGKVDEGATFYFSLPASHTHTHTHKMTPVPDEN